MALLNLPKPLPDYSKRHLLEFFEASVSAGHIKPNTAGGVRTALKALDSLSDDADVTRADLEALVAVRFPVEEVSDSTSKVYVSRVRALISQFQKLVGAGLTASDLKSYSSTLKSASNLLDKTLDEPSTGTAFFKKMAMPEGTPADHTMTHVFPLRADLNVTLVLPRDLNESEANMLSAFLKALAVRQAWN